MITTLVLSLAAGFAAYCIYGWLQTRKALRSMTSIERMNAQIDEAKRKEDKLKPKDRLRAYLRKQGYDGDLGPFMAAVTFGYMVVVLVLRLVGASDIIAVLISLPVVAAGVVWALSYAATRKRRLFNHQLLQALTLVASQVSAGNGAHRAIEQVIPSLQDPIRSELTRVMDATVVSKDLVSSMRGLYERYPSRAFEMFIAALEIDQAKGGRLEPALNQAAATLQRDFDLSQEAVAEISQTRSEFFSVIAIIGFVTFSMFAGGGDEARSAYLSFVGVVGIGAAALNFLWGVWRATRIFNNAKGDA